MKRGLVELLDAAATIIETEAATLKRTHTLASGRWDRSAAAVDVKAEHDEMIAVAKGLRAARKERLANPLGGSAIVFWSIANRVWAGDGLKETMKDFGVRWVK